MSNKTTTPILNLDGNENRKFQVDRDNFSVKISKKDLIEIVEKASGFAERLSDKFVADRTQKSEKIIDSRLDKWCQVVAKGDRQKFDKHLDWSSLDLDRVRQVFGKVNLLDERDLPSWINTLHEAMKFAPSLNGEVLPSNDPKKPNYLDPEDPIPFEEVLLPFVEVARKKLSDRIIFDEHLISTDAIAELERSLLTRLSQLAIYSLDLEFSLFRSLRVSSLGLLLGQVQQNPAKKQYAEFVNNLLQDRLLSFLQEYSVLARMLAIATDFWIETTEELMQRITSDWNEIQTTFQPDRELGQITSIESSLSDPHNRGRSVFIVTFAYGFKLVYKPKSLGLEKAYFDFLAWINQQQVVLPFQLLKVIDRSTYGWMEFVSNQPCEDQRAVCRYYRRAGTILGIVYALRGTDFHCENLIACGEQPVAIDIETLLHHRIFSIDEATAEAQAIANQSLAESVTSTALLPGVKINLGKIDDSSADVDFGGLVGSEEHELSFPSMQWKNINTDSMMLVSEVTTIPAQKNFPFGEGLETSLSSHKKEFINGFREIWQFFLDKKELLLGVNSPLERFKQKKVRLVLRNTQLYYSVWQNCLNPKYLRDGIDYSIQLDILGRGFLNSEEQHPFWNILALEKQALERSDIPFFHAYSHSTDLTGNSEQTIESILSSPSYDDVIARLQQLDNDTLDRQISIIHSSFYSSLKDKDLDLSKLQNVETVVEPIPNLTEEKILAEAIDLAEELKQKAIYGSNNTVAWIGLEYIPKLDLDRFQTLSLSLDSGCCGIAIFLAALSKVTGDREYEKLALDSLQFFRQFIQKSKLRSPESDANAIDNHKIVVTKELAATIYTFVRLAEFLNEPSLLEDAQTISSWLTVDRLTGEDLSDNSGDIAGIILGLLSLYEVVPSPELLIQAKNWGKHLLDKRVVTDDKYLVWQTPKENILTGYSHGIAEINHALLRLYTATQDDLFLVAAKEAINYQQNILFANKKDLDSKCEVSNLSGIALSLLGSLTVVDTKEIARELEDILEEIQSSKLKVLDNLAIGNFSDIEILLVAARQLNRSKLRDIAQHRIAQILSKKEQLGSFQLLPNLPVEVYHPGFSLGKAGIGYELLRSIHLDLLPSVLLWE
jgi:type 2 lantibiotic biosynthesis protein LanM